MDVVMEKTIALLMDGAKLCAGSKMVYVASSSPFTVLQVSLLFTIREWDS